MNGLPVTKVKIPAGEKFAYCSCSVGIKELQSTEAIQEKCNCKITQKETTKN